MDSQYLYFWIKLFFLCETFIAIFSRKFEIVTAYQLFHHSTLPLLVWYATNFMPGGNSLFFGLVNLSSHALIKFYQVTTVLIPSLKQPWSRKFFMFAHIIQFTLIALHGSQLIFDNYCNYPTDLLYILFGWGVIIYVLYCKAWMNPQYKKKPLKEESHSTIVIQPV